MITIFYSIIHLGFQDSIGLKIETLVVVLAWGSCSWFGNGYLGLVLV